MTHTPGPWHVDSTHVSHAINNQEVHIALANIGPGLLQEEALANAYLIAAAPTLLEACEYFIEDVNEMGIEIDYAFAVEQIKAAIAKAKGEADEG